MNILNKKQFNRASLIIFLERLELYISSGLTLDKALVVSLEGISTKQREVVARIHKAVESGNTLSFTLWEYLRIPMTLRGLIANGESTGRLAEALHSSRQLLEREDELRKKCVGAMIYPVVIAIFALTLAMGLMRGVMPQIVPMLKSLRIELPLSTKTIIFLSDILSAYWIHITLCLIVLPIVSVYMYSRYQPFKRFSQMAIVNIPLVGNLIYSYYLSIFLRSCGSMIVSGLLGVSAYRESVNSISFIPLKDGLTRMLSPIENGISFCSALREVRGMPLFVPALLSAGEISGTLGESIVRSAEIIDRNIENSLKRLTALIEPIMMVGIGIMVGAIALSIMMPIYDVSKILQR